MYVEKRGQAWLHGAPTTRDSSMETIHIDYQTIISCLCCIWLCVVVSGRSWGCVLLLKSNPVVSGVAKRSGKRSPLSNLIYIIDLMINPKKKTVIYREGTWGEGSGDRRSRQQRLRLS